MSLRRLVQSLAAVTDLPIEITLVREKIIELGIQDEIRFVDEPLDTGRLLGAFHQYVRRDSTYSLPDLCSIVVYPSGEPHSMQRLIACKEMLHVYDTALERTATKAAVTGLVDKMLGPLSTTEFGHIQLMALRDQIAIYLALAVLFPEAARNQVLEHYRAGRLTLEQIAEWAALPMASVALVLADGWPELCKDFLDC